MRKRRFGIGETEQRNIAVLFLFFSPLFSFLFFCHAFAFCFEEAGKKYGISPKILMAIAEVESGWNPLALNINRNASVDVGIMQINSIWFDELSRRWGVPKEEVVSLLFDPCYNIMVGAEILHRCMKKAKGKHSRQSRNSEHDYLYDALRCYNGSPKYPPIVLKVLKKYGYIENKSSKKSNPRSDTSDVHTWFRVFRIRPFEKK